MHDVVTYLYIASYSYDMKTACACIIALPLILLLLPQSVVNVTEGEVPPFCKVVTVTEYTLDCRRLDIVVLVGTFEPEKERDPVCIPLPHISDHCTLYPVAPSTSSQETVAVVHVISIILTFVGAAGSM